MIKLGDEIIWTGSLTGPEEIRQGTVTKIRNVGKDILVFVDNQHKPEDCIYAAYCWPSRVKDELIEILTERKRLQKAADGSMKLVYQLRNQIVRGEK